MLRVAKPPPPDKEQSWLAQVGSGGILRGFLGGEREERRKDGKDSNVGVFAPSEQVRRMTCDFSSLPCFYGLESEPIPFAQEWVPVCIRH